jgi:hypothetical protein
MNYDSFFIYRYSFRLRKKTENMLTSYYNEAKYRVIFNYPQLNFYGALTDDHFAAMKYFLNYINQFPRNKYGIAKGEVGFVLPKDYGWGMREADDKM